MGENEENTVENGTEEGTDLPENAQAWESAGATEGGEGETEDAESYDVVSSPASGSSGGESRADYTEVVERLDTIAGNIQRVEGVGVAIMAVAAILVGVVLAVAVSKLFMQMWR